MSHTPTHSIALWESMGGGAQSDSDRQTARAALSLHSSLSRVSDPLSQVSHIHVIFLMYSIAKRKVACEEKGHTLIHYSYNCNGQTRVQ